MPTDYMLCDAMEDADNMLLFCCEKQETGLLRVVRGVYSP